jgi:hypothetical protein
MSSRDLEGRGYFTEEKEEFFFPPKRSCRRQIPSADSFSSAPDFIFFGYSGRREELITHVSSDDVSKHGLVHKAGIQVVSKVTTG